MKEEIKKQEEEKIRKDEEEKRKFREMEDEKNRLEQLKEHQMIEEELEKQIEEARKLAMQEQIKHELQRLKDQVKEGNIQKDLFECNYLFIFYAYLHVSIYLLFLLHAIINSLNNEARV